MIHLVANIALKHTAGSHLCSHNCNTLGFLWVFQYHISKSTAPKTLTCINKSTYIFCDLKWRMFPGLVVLFWFHLLFKGLLWLLFRCSVCCFFLLFVLFKKRHQGGKAYKQLLKLFKINYIKLSSFSLATLCWKQKYWAVLCSWGKLWT